jgi:hypothetical protein
MFLAPLRRPIEEVNTKYDRDGVVYAAATCVTCADLPQLLSERPGEAKKAKVWKVMKLLARPITTTQLLIQIARLLPQFRNISFCWQTPPDPMQLDKKYVVTLEDAWDSGTSAHLSAHASHPYEPRKELQAGLFSWIFTWKEYGRDTGGRSARNSQSVIVEEAPNYYRLLT